MQDNIRNKNNCENHDFFFIFYPVEIRKHEKLLENETIDQKETDITSTYCLAIYYYLFHVNQK